MVNRHLSVSVTLVLIVLNVLVWLAFGAVIIANAHPALHVSPPVKGLMAFLSFVIAGILLVLFVFLGKRNRSAYLITLALFATLSIVNFFDDFGLVDLVVLVINVAPLVLLIKDRVWYLQTKPEPNEPS